MSPVSNVQSWVKGSTGLLRPGRPTRPTNVVKPAGWTTLEWAEDFTGSAVDASRWAVANGRRASNEMSICYPGNVSVANSNLIIQPKLETTTYSGTTRNYTSGYLDTAGHYAAQRPCRVEACMALPLADGTSAGMWPAFWLRDITGAGEIDIMEAWGEPSLQDGTPAEKPGGRYAAHAYPDTATTAGGKGTWTGPTGLDLTTYHVYAVDISEDGSLAFSLDYSFANQLSFSYAQNSFLQTSFPGGYKIILNLQVGSSWDGPPTAATDWSQAMRVDWVRVWKR